MLCSMMCLVSVAVHSQSLPALQAQSVRCRLQLCAPTATTTPLPRRRRAFSREANGYAPFLLPASAASVGAHALLALGALFALHQMGLSFIVVLPAYGPWSQARPTGSLCSVKCTQEEYAYEAG